MNEDKFIIIDTFDKNNYKFYYCWIGNDWAEDDTIFMTQDISKAHIFEKSESALDVIIGVGYYATKYVSEETDEEIEIDTSYLKVGKLTTTFELIDMSEFKKDN